MFRIIIAFIFILFTYPTFVGNTQAFVGNTKAFAGNAPDFNTLKKIWGNFDSIKMTKSGTYKYTVAVRKGKATASRNMYMLSPENPEMLLWIFYESREKRSTNSKFSDNIIRNLELKDLSSWYGALIVIVDSGSSLYSYNPDNSLSEIQIYNGIYNRLVKLYGLLPTVIIGISSGAEGAVKFAPFVNKLNSLVCISGIYNYNLLPTDSKEYKIRIKEYGSAEGWELEQPVKILPSIKCNITLLSEENSIYRKQAETASQIPGIKKIKIIKKIGKGQLHDWKFWGSTEIKKFLNREIQAASGN